MHVGLPARWSSLTYSAVRALSSCEGKETDARGMKVEGLDKTVGKNVLVRR